jgi:hypothetical protein
LFQNSCHDWSPCAAKLTCIGAALGAGCDVPCPPAAPHAATTVPATPAAAPANRRRRVGQVGRAGDALGPDIVGLSVPAPACAAGEAASLRVAFIGMLPSCG